MKLLKFRAKEFLIKTSNLDDFAGANICVARKPKLQRLFIEDLW